MRFVTEKEAWKGLCNAIIMQACADYPDSDAISFLRSDWFIWLSGGCIDCEVLINRLEEIKKQNNRKFFKENLI